eukprot:TRINITY_DN20143_c0_g1_i1.p1 TRINITY_DN20143_c0_g1~~TRINITY_DN20143_c0_g1_i1.p1  ORF type:complete len:1333 (-),score=277.56 TRINITY_DN20143_c0_g1_i1:69-3989(-)
MAAVGHLRPLPWRSSVPAVATPAGVASRRRGGRRGVAGAPTGPQDDVGLASGSGGVRAAVDPALLLGMQATSSSSAVVQQANAVFNRVRGGHATAEQLVAAVRELAVIGRTASAEDLEALSARQSTQQVLRDLTASLPRDASEKVKWDQAWVAQVVDSLQQLRVRDVDPQLGVRLGHALLQAAPTMELEALLQATCNICTTFGGRTRGSDPKRPGPSPPDDYSLWVFGQRLTELCESRRPGELEMAHLVRLLHRFAHPALRGRVPARSSPSVLRHVRHGLATSSLGDIAKIVQAYAEEPAAADVVAAAISELSQTPTGANRLLSGTLPELTAVAAVLPSFKARSEGSEVTAAAVAKSTLRRLTELLAQDHGTNLELSLSCASDAAKAADDEGRSLAGDIFGAIGMRAAAGETATALSVDAQCRLLREGLAHTAAISRGAGASVADGAEEAANAAPWPQAIAAALADRLGELSSSSLAGLATALADASAEAEIGPEILEALENVAKARAHEFQPEDAAAIAYACAKAGTLSATSENGGFLEAYDIDAALARGLRPGHTAQFAWSAVVAEALDGDEAKEKFSAWWPLLEWRLSSDRQAWETAPAEDKALLYEALAAHTHMRDLTWEPGNRVGDILRNDAWRKCWLERRNAVHPPSTQVADVASVLQEAGIVHERDTASVDTLYLAQLYLPNEKVIIDMLPSKATHPVSKVMRGDVLLRHTIWTWLGMGVLAIEDSVWMRVSANAAPVAAQEATAADTLPKVSTAAEHAPSASHTVPADSGPSAKSADSASMPSTSAPSAGVAPSKAATPPKEPATAESPMSTTPASVAAAEPLLKPATQSLESSPVSSASTSLPSDVVASSKAVESFSETPSVVTSGESASAEPVASAQTSTPVVAMTATEATNVENVREKRREWLQDKLDSLRRVHFATAHGLSLELVNKLRGFPLGDDGLNVDAFKALARQSESVQNISIDRFLDSVREKNVVQPTGWLIGIIKREAKSEEDRKARSEAEAKVRARKKSESEVAPRAAKTPAAALSAAASPAPSAATSVAGDAADSPKRWGNPNGKPISDVKVGTKVSGIVTNILHGRVWVDAGFVMDASFFVGNTAHSYKVDSKVEGLKVVSVSQEPARIEVRPTYATRAARKTVARDRQARTQRTIAEAAASAKGKGGGEKGDGAVSGGAAANREGNSDVAAPSGDDVAKSTASREAKTSGPRPKTLEAAEKRPQEGWNHSSGRAIAELRVGEAVTGRVTNVLRRSVWVNVGAQNDAMFLADQGRFQVGDELRDLIITGVDLERGHIKVAPPRE